jgi:hypothetical protein
MIIDINMFGPFMISWVIGNAYAPIIIFKNNYSVVVGGPI